MNNLRFVVINTCLHIQFALTPPPSPYDSHLAKGRGDARREKESV